jgi:hypothetical protein
VHDVVVVVVFIVRVVAAVATLIVFVTRTGICSVVERNL